MSKTRSRSLWLGMFAVAVSLGASCNLGADRPAAPLGTQAQGLSAGMAYEVKDLYPGTTAGGSQNSGMPPYFTAYPLGDAIVFNAEDGVHGVEPWVSDGTEMGTRLLHDINNGSPSSTTTRRSLARAITAKQNTAMKTRAALILIIVGRLSESLQHRSGVLRVAATGKALQIPFEQ